MLDLIRDIARIPGEMAGGIVGGIVGGVTPAVRELFPPPAESKPIPVELFLIGGGVLVLILVLK
jgi:hypothetical protein